MTLDIETVSALMAGIAAAATTAVTVWTKVSPVVKEVLELVRGSAAAVGAHPDEVSVVDRIDALSLDMCTRLDTQAERLSALETRVSKLDCQVCPSTLAPPPPPVQ